MSNELINLQEEYNKTDISRILEILDEELVGLKPVYTCHLQVAQEQVKQQWH
jgi:hypothetical protein